MVSSSSDKTMALWDLEAGKFYFKPIKVTFSNVLILIGVRVRRFKGHQSYVNSCDVSENPVMICSASDDGTVRLWDSRRRYCVKTLNNKFQVLL